MTPKELPQEIRDEAKAKYPDAPFMSSIFAKREGYIAGALAERERNKWIPMKSGSFPPDTPTGEIDLEYLVIYDHEVRVLSWDSEHLDWYGKQGYVCPAKSVTYWQPLPSPPQQK